METCIVPNDFGDVNGSAISNKDTILDEINESLGKQNPSVEYILVKPFAMVKLPFGYGFSYNAYGHSAVRYTDPSGRDVVMNIEGKKDGVFMVQFYDANEYLYGTDSNKNGSQKGVYNRDMMGIRVEDISKENVIAMHNYFLELRDQEQKHMKKFNIIFGPIINFIGKFVSLPVIHRSPTQTTAGRNCEYGNCAKWTSEGLKRAGVVTSVSVWPKSIFIDIFENYKKTNVKKRDNMNVVYYKRPEKAKLAYGRDAYALEGVAPFQALRSFVYSDLTKYANRYVTVGKDDTHASISVNPFPKDPNYIRNLLNNTYFIMGSVVITGLVARKGVHYVANLRTFYRKYVDKYAKI
jgi:hypothetical protein